MMIEELFERNNIMGFILKITGLVVIIWGIIQGFIALAEFSSEYDEVPILVLTVFLKPIILGLLIIGLGEALDLLQELVDKGKPKPEVKKHTASILPKIPLYDEADLREYYSNKGMEIDTIKPTKRRDVFVVEANGKKEYIELGGFSPRELSEQEVQEYED